MKTLALVTLAVIVGMGWNIIRDYGRPCSVVVVRQSHTDTLAVHTLCP